MAVVMRCLGFASGGGPVDQYLAAFDPEAGDGWGDATFTDALADAMRFADVAEAYRFLGTRPAARPIRPDGKPNRPLTAFTMTFDHVPDAVPDPGAEP
jgi:hypothetical protein